MTAESDGSISRFFDLHHLHRGFRDIQKENYGTAFTAWETPLPQLTWSHLPIGTIKTMLEEGGFPWEVIEANKRKHKKELDDREID